MLSNIYTVKKAYIMKIPREVHLKKRGSSKIDLLIACTDCLISDSTVFTALCAALVLAQGTIFFMRVFECVFILHLSIHYVLC